MKSLILALLLFGVVVYGCYDVKPFRPIKRALRRVPGSKTGPLRPQTGPLDEYEDAIATGTGPLSRRERR
jgi:hypothetical protein